MSAQTNAGPQAYSTSSWALGVVVPEGAPLQGGGSLRWEDANNVTASFTLPDISVPDGLVYAVLSVMTGNGSVLQAAVGIRHNESDWFTYSWSISSPSSVPLTYQWVLNASVPEVAPLANLTVSIFRSSGPWSLRVLDESTGASVEHGFPSRQRASLRAGDQEVFSLESYSRSGSTFRNMGNLTLGGIFVDGARIEGGTYTYGGWDPSHNPLFAVGSSGSDPPTFISLGQTKGGSFVWEYATSWGSGGDSAAAFMEAFALLLIVSLSALGVVLWKTRSKAPSSGPHSRSW